MKTLIIGGAGAFGSFYAKRFSEDGFEVDITDSKSTRAKDLCENHNCTSVKEIIYEKYDCIIISVPNAVAPEVLRKTLENAKKGTLIFDFCSVKEGVFKVYNEFSDKGFELVSIHPMHGPRVPSIHSYPIAIIKINTADKFEEILSFFNKRKGQIIYTNQKEHDETLAIVQGLTHFSQFVNASVLRKLDANIKRTMEFGSPNYSLFLNLISRVILQNPELYSQIQLSNPYNEKIRNLFREATDELFEISTHNDAEELTDYLIDEAKEFKDPDLFLLDSDRAVNALKYLITTLEKNKGKHALIENVITNNFHYGIIKDVNNKELTIKEWNRDIKIGIPKVRYCTKPELREWRLTHLKRKNVDFSFLVDKNCSKEIITKIFISVKDVDFEVIDEFESEKFPEDKKSITLRATYFEDDNKEFIKESIHKIIKGLGFVER
jgi:prephenate dehydrogenase